MIRTSRLCDPAQFLGITERAVQRIVQELQQAGVSTRTGLSKRNSYEVHSGRHLRHPLEGHCSVGDSLKMVNGCTDHS